MPTGHLRKIQCPTDLRGSVIAACIRTRDCNSRRILGRDTEVASGLPSTEGGVDRRPSRIAGEVQMRRAGEARRPSGLGGLRAMGPGGR